MSGMIQKEWRTEHVIRSYDVGPNCDVRLPVLCRYMQEAAYQHAEHLGLGHTQLAVDGISWVLSRMRIEVEQVPKWGGSVHLRTWPSGRDRMYYYRDFEITDGEGRPVLKASTAWFIINVETRERSVPDWWKTAEYPLAPKVFNDRLNRLKAGSGEAGVPVQVNYSDLDQNGHVNNVCYIEWILDRLPLDFHLERRVRSLEVNYLSEAVYGHEVSVRTEESGHGVYAHSIIAEGSDLFRARSTWQAI